MICKLLSKNNSVNSQQFKHWRHAGASSSPLGQSAVPSHNHSLCIQRPSWHLYSKSWHSFETTDVFISVTSL